MKNQLFLMGTLLFYTGWLVAGNMQEAFLQANIAYNAGKVQAALKLYKSIEPKGSAVFYNMGNCYFKLGSYPKAIVYWRRAQKNASSRDISTLEQYIIRAYQAQNATYKQSWGARFHMSIIRCGSMCSLFILQIIFLCCLWALFILGPTLIKQSRYIVLILLSASTVAVACVGVFNYRFQEYPYGIVTKNVISVYAGPGRDYARLMEARALDEVRIYQKRDGWLKVRIDQCGYGWVEKTDLAEI
jgi:tetratricopeptide (TPR) repeat protein